MVRQYSSEDSITINRSIEQTFHTVALAEDVKFPLSVGRLFRLRSSSKVVNARLSHWDAPGDTRQLNFALGSSMQETLTAFEVDSVIAGRLDDCRGPIRILLTQVTYEWRFSNTSATTTRLNWKVNFQLRSVLTAPIILLLLKRTWPKYVDTMLSRLKKLSESEPSDN